VKSPFVLVASERFEEQAVRLPEAVYKQLRTRLSFLASDPRHPSFKTHEVTGAIGDHGGKVFEAYVSDKYRMTWEYGPSKGEITLRNVDNHDECLNSP
jgi:hypothetical protein